MRKFLVKLFAFVLVCTAITSVRLPANAAEYSTYATNRASDFPFTMAPNTQVLTLWVTNRNDNMKHSFVPGHYEGTTLLLRGTFKHAAAGGQCKSGVCISNSGIYDAQLSAYQVNGSSFGDITNQTVLGAMSRLDQDKTHYGFIKNNIGSGYVYDANLTISIA